MLVILGHQCYMLVIQSDYMRPLFGLQNPRNVNVVTIDGMINITPCSTVQSAEQRPNFAGLKLLR